MKLTNSNIMTVKISMRILLKGTTKIVMPKVTNMILSRKDKSNKIQSSVLRAWYPKSVSVRGIQLSNL